MKVLSNKNVPSKSTTLSASPDVLRRSTLAVIALACLLSSGCALRKIAVHKLGDALAQGGTTFSSDNDPELIAAAAPFSLKLMETLLAEAPRHRGLLLAACSGFTQYAYAFVHEHADEVEQTDVDEAKRLRQRARQLYLRARDFGLRGLDESVAGFSTELRTDPEEAVRRCQPDDAPLLYWTAVSWAAAVSVSKNDARLLADLPVIEAMIFRALELREDYDRGAIHTFLITYQMSRAAPPGETEKQARMHFQRAVALSRGTQAAPYLALAESVCVPLQRRAEFESLLQHALAIDLDADPSSRLANTVLLRRARRLQSQIDDLFLTPGRKEP